MLQLRVTVQETLTACYNQRALYRRHSLHAVQAGTALSHLQYASPRNKLRQSAFLGHPSSSRRLAWNTSTRSVSAHKPLNSPLQTQRQQLSSSAGGVSDAHSGRTVAAACNLQERQVQQQRRVSSAGNDPLDLQHGLDAQQVQHAEVKSRVAAAADAAQCSAAGLAAAPVAAQTRSGSASEAAQCGASSSIRPAVPLLGLAAVQDRRRAALGVQGPFCWVCNAQGLHVCICYYWDYCSC